MAEYLSPGVYVEEFDSGIKAMEGVGTSTAGFIGMAQKGPVKGMPVLLTGMADYQRRFGGYLPERTYGSQRFLPYAVEQFFNNGGATCYVMRVCDQSQEGGAAAATGQAGAAGSEFITVAAADPGEWGNAIHIRLKENLKTKSLITAKLPAAAVQKSLELLEAEHTALLARQAAESALAEAVKNAEKAENDYAEAAEENKEECRAVLEKANLAVKDAQAADAAAEKTLAEAKNAYEDACADMYYEVKDSSSFQAGDMVCIKAAGILPEVRYTVIEKIDGNKVYPKWATYEKQAEKASGDAAGYYMYLTEWDLSAQDNTAAESYAGIGFNEDRSNYLPDSAEKSKLFVIKVNTKKLVSGVMEELVKPCIDRQEEDIYFDITMSGGADAAVKMDPDIYLGKDPGDPGSRTGLEAFKTLTDVSIMAIPGITDKNVQSGLVTHCENMSSRFAILDMPLEDKDVADLQAFRENVDSTFSAMYHPWLQGYDGLLKKNVYFPPSGSMAGVYARTDNTRGVHKAPANEIVKNCTGLSVNYNEAEQGKLNPKGINLIRAIPGQGIRVWGARTCSSDGNWKYVNVRRLFIYIEESIKANTNWAVFEPNDELLWSRVEGTIKVFLTTLWRNGALTGSSAEEAFFINIGKSTMTQDDILNGRLICVIGVAPVRPAEFVIFRITQKMETAQ